MVDDSVLIGGPEVHTYDHGEDLQLGEHCGDVRGDGFTLLHECRILLNYDLSAIDGCGKTNLLKFTDDRSRSERGGSLGDHDVERCDLPGLRGSLRLGRLELLEKLEGVDVRRDDRTLSVDLVLESLELRLGLRSLLECEKDEVVLSHLDDGVSPETGPH